jgi:sec-independent protein translocase protein TatA
MFGFHAWDLLIVLAIVLLIFGARRLPEMGNALGQTIQMFKKGASSVEESKSDKAPPEIPEKTTSDK